MLRSQLSGQSKGTGPQGHVGLVARKRVTLETLTQDVVERACKLRGRAGAPSCMPGLGPGLAGREAPVLELAREVLGLACGLELGSGDGWISGPGGRRWGARGGIQGRDGI